MDRRRAVNVGLMVGVPFVSGLLVGALLLGSSAARPALELPATFLGFLSLPVAVAALVIGYCQSNAVHQTLQRREDGLAQLQAEFVQNVNHELRHPLTLVRGYVDILSREELPEEERQRLASLALERTMHLVERVEAISAFHEVRRGKMHAELVDMADLAETALKMVWQKAYRAGVTLHLDCPVEPALVSGDPLWLLEALEQLLCNGIKFSGDGGAVSLRLCATSGEVCVEVADHGVGVVGQQLEQVFAPFCQVDGSSSRRFGGVGVGLAIVQEVAKAHNGRVSLSSGGQGEGSTFTLALPAT